MMEAPPPPPPAADLRVHARVSQEAPQHAPACSGTDLLTHKRVRVSWIDFHQRRYPPSPVPPLLLYHSTVIR